MAVNNINKSLYLFYVFMMYLFLNLIFLDYVASASFSSSIESQ